MVERGIDRLTSQLRRVADERVRMAEELSKYTVRGNAAGAIGSLSFMGAIIGRSGEVPVLAFWVLVTFLAGLAISWLRVSWRARTSLGVKIVVRTEFGFALETAFLIGTSWLSAAALAVGTVGALIFLHGLTI